MEQLPQLHRVAHIGQDGRDVGAVAGPEQDAQQQNGQDGADRTEGHEAEAVVRRVTVASDGGHTDTQRHDEGHRDGAGGHAAGVKGDGQELFGHEGRQHEDQPVEHDEELGQRDAQQHAQEGHDEEEAHARRDREDERHVGDGGDLVGQDLQVRLGDGDEEAQRKPHPDDEGDAAAPGQHRAHPLAHGAHAHLGTQGKEHDAHDDHGRTQQKAEQDAGGDRRDGKAEHQHDRHDGQHGLQCFEQFFPQFGKRTFAYSVHRPFWTCFASE